MTENNKLIPQENKEFEMRIQGGLEEDLEKYVQQGTISEETKKEVLAKYKKDKELIIESRKGITLEDLKNAQIKNGFTNGKAYVNKVSVKKYKVESGIQENINGSFDIQSNSTNLVIGGKAVFSNDDNINNYFIATTRYTIRISLESIKELFRTNKDKIINLSFAEVGGKYYNVNLRITTGGWLNINNGQQISGMPKNLSEEMVKGKIDEMILKAITDGKLSIEAANDMHFNYGPFSKEVVNKFLTQQLTAEDMNKMRTNGNI